jgi:hypothetical protein
MMPLSGMGWEGAASRTIREPEDLLIELHGNRCFSRQKSGCGLWMKYGIPGPD